MFFTQQTPQVAYGEESSSSTQDQLPYTHGSIGFLHQGNLQGAMTPPRYQPEGFDPTTCQIGCTPEKPDPNDDSSSLLKALPFMKLLASKGGFSLVDCSSGLSSLSVEAPAPAMAENQHSTRGLASFPPQTSGLLGGGTNQHGGSFYDIENIINLTPYNSMGSGLLDDDRQGNMPVFAPSTPNPMKKVAPENNLVSPEAYSVACQNTFNSAQEENVDSASSRRCTDLQVDPAAQQEVRADLALSFHEEETGKMISGDPEVDAAAGLDKLNQQKPRRKKHRPKVVRENQAKRVPNPRTPQKPVDPNTPPRVKRTYVRRNKIKTPPPPSTTTPPLKERAKPLHPEVPKPTTKRTLNFDSEDLSRRDVSSSDKPNEYFQSEQAPLTGNVQDPGIQSAIEERPLECLGRNFNSPAGVDPSSGNGDSTDMLFGRKLYYNTSSIPVMLIPESCKKRRTGKISKPNKTGTYQSASDFSSNQVPSINLGTTACSNEERQYTSWADLDRLKKKRSRTAIRARDQDSLNAVCKEMPPDSFNAVCEQILPPPPKKKRKYTRKQAPKALTSLPSCSEALAGVVGKPATRRRSKPKTTPVRSRHLNFNRTNMPNSLVLYNHQQFTCDVPGTLLALPWSKMISVDDIAEKFQQLHITQKSSKQNQQSNAIIPYQGRRRKEQNALVLYRRDGTMVASYATSDQARKGKSRAKVNLDNETERVWKLLLMDINSEGIDGTDEEKAKWWEKERKTFHGRVESFIGRMNDVQGQRKFSPWKGSVVDSVVGVFLTQNVSDHLSSSAFMSMVARFPVRSDIAQRTSYAEQAAPLIEEPEDCEEVTCNDAGAARTMEGPVYDKIIHEFDICFGKELEESQDCYCAASPKDGPSQYVKITNNNEAKSDESRVYKNDKIASETQTASDLADAKTEDVTSSQQSVVSSQNSANSPSAPQVINFCQNIEDNSDVENLTLTSSSNRFERQTSFVALLTTIHQQCQSPQQNSDQGQLVGSRPDEIKHGVSRSELAHNSLVYQNVSSAAYQLQQMADNFEVPDKDIQFLGNSQRMDESCQTEYMAKVSTPRNDQDLTASSYIYGDNCLRSSLVASNLPPMDQHIEESIFSNNLTKKDERCIAKHSAGTTEPTSQPFFLEKSTERVPKCCPGTCSCYVLEGEVMVVKSIKLLVKRQQSETELPTPGQESSMERNPEVHTSFGDNVSVTQSTSISTSRECNGNQPVQLVIDHERSSHKSTDVVKKEIPTKSASKAGKEKGAAFDWDRLRREAQSRGTSHERTRNTMDSVDWEAVRCSAVSDVADTIKERGMNNVLAGRIQNFLNRLVSDHGSIDLEWLRDVPPDKAKEYLLSIRGLGLKSVECVRLLTLHHLAFPVDTNVGRIAVRLGWVPLQPLPESLQLHLLELYPVLESIQKYLWPRLCKLDQHTLYELHYHMITFGKVFCTKKQPNCNACPLRGECRHFASAFASARLSLPGPEQQSIISATQNAFTQRDSSVPMAHFPVPLPLENHLSEARYEIRSSRPMVEVPVSSEPIVEVPASPEPIVEVPASPEPDQTQSQQCDIENIFDDDPNEIPTIKLNIQQFSQNLQTYIQSMELDSRNMCNALVALTPEVASIPTPKLKNVSRLRTEHHVYELPDTHTLLERMPQREQDDPCPYLLAVWTPGETADSIQPPERRCNNEEPNQLCNDETCFYCSSLREAQSKIVRATLLIPCRTAMRGSFPLNGTYFQVNEVFADHDSSLNPMNVPRGLIWNLPRRTVYFGTSIPTIFRGLSTIEIQQCFYKGYVCVRGFDQKTRAPKPLKARLHFPASKKTRSRGKNVQED